MMCLHSWQARFRHLSWNFFLVKNSGAEWKQEKKKCAGRQNKLAAFSIWFLQESWLHLHSLHFYFHLFASTRIFQSVFFPHPSCDSLPIFSRLQHLLIILRFFGRTVCLVFIACHVHAKILSGARQFSLPLFLFQWSHASLFAGFFFLVALNSHVWIASATSAIIHSTVFTLFWAFNRLRSAAHLIANKHTECSIACAYCTTMPSNQLC